MYINKIRYKNKATFDYFEIWLGEDISIFDHELFEAKMGQYLFGCIAPDRVNKRQNGQRFNDGEKFYTLTAQDKHGVLIDGYIRKLTPVECERLQTLPDNYTKCDSVSEPARYKALGNCWTVNVIAHCFGYIKN